MYPPNGIDIECKTKWAVGYGTNVFIIRFIEELEVNGSHIGEVMFKIEWAVTFAYIEFILSNSVLHLSSAVMLSLFAVKLRPELLVGMTRLEFW